MATVLIVEDDVMMRSTIKSMLEDDGHEIFEAEDGLAAIDTLNILISHRAVSLVITDILMPRVDGMSLITWIRKLDRSIKILAISGGSRAIFSDILSASRRLGAHASLKKPFTRQQLREKIDRLLAT